MIDYELATELKDNGFPQSPYMNQLCEHEDFSHKLSSKVLKCDWVSVPTLSELIEACGGDFGGLLKGNFLIWDYGNRKYNDFNGFYAGTVDGSDGSSLSVDYEPHGYGKTPEEAVAKLWLAINKK
jgi:hypothetical protein